MLFQPFWGEVVARTLMERDLIMNYYLSFGIILVIFMIMIIASLSDNKARSGAVIIGLVLGIFVIVLCFYAAMGRIGDMDRNLSEGTYYEFVGQVKTTSLESVIIIRCPNGSLRALRFDIGSFLLSFENGTMVRWDGKTLLPLTPSTTSQTTNTVSSK